MYSQSFLVQAFSPELLSPLRRLFEREIAPALLPEMLTGGTRWQQRLAATDFAVFSYNAAPLLWISGNNARGFGWFQAFFDQLNLPSIDGQPPQLYGGFFVVGNKASELLWHDDYTEFANAYTLLTPLYPFREDQGHLLYYPVIADDNTAAPDINIQEPLQYTYKEGEALLIGHGLQHATEPYVSKHLRVLVSLTFGGQDMQYWPQLKPVLKGQSFFYRKPCGHLSKQRCLCALRHTGFAF
jgi:hypothetical protein